MRLERLSSNNLCFYDRAIALYQSSFPFEERRETLEQQRVLNKDDYHFDLILNEEKFIGIALYWERENYIFLEHFAVEINERGKGYGAKTLEMLKQKNKAILLEIEVPVDQITNRRYGFYKRNGFVMNPYYHIQAKYHKGDSDLELKILSFPQVLKEHEYKDFYEYMQKEIAIQGN